MEAMHRVFVATLLAIARFAANDLPVATVLAYLSIEALFLTLAIKELRGFRFEGWSGFPQQDSLL